MHAKKNMHYCEHPDTNQGYHSPKVTLVILINVDSEFFSADYRAMKKRPTYFTSDGSCESRKDERVAVIQTGFSDQPAKRARTGLHRALMQ